MPESAEITQEILTLLREKKKISSEDIAKRFDKTQEEIFSIMNPLLKEQKVDVEYKYTIPYFYLSASAHGQLQKQKNPAPEINPTLLKSEPLTPEIAHLIEEFKEKIAQKKIPPAAETYQKILSALYTTPEVHRIPYILTIAGLKTQLGEILKDDFDIKTVEHTIQNLIEQCQVHLSNKRIVEAKQSYEHAFALYNQIPDDFIERKSKLRPTLIDLYKEVNAQYSKLMYWKLIEVTAYIEDLLKTGKNYLSHNDLRGALDIYGRCIEVLNKLPPAFIKKRMAIYNELFEFYKETSIKADIQKLQQEISK